MPAPRFRAVVPLVTLLLTSWVGAWAQCPEEPALQNWTGGGTATCPCFIPGERAGAVLELVRGQEGGETRRPGASGG